MKLFLILFFAFPFCAEAFFWGKPDYKKAFEILSEMERKYDIENCDFVFKEYKELLSQKPPVEIKRKADFLYGSCHEKNHSYESAIAVYKMAIELYEDDEVFKEHLADIYLKSEFFDRALQLLSEIEKKRPYDIDLWFKIAKAYKGMGLLRNALPYYRKYIAAKGYDDKAEFQEYCLFLRELSFFKESYELSTDAFLRFADYDFLVLAALNKANMGDLTQALHLLLSVKKENQCNDKCVKMILVYSFFLKEDFLFKENLRLLPESDYFRKYMEGLMFYSENKMKDAKSALKYAAENGDDFIKKSAVNLIEKGGKR